MKHKRCLLACLAVACADRPRVDPDGSTPEIGYVQTRDAAARRQNPLPPSADAAIDLWLAGRPLQAEPPEPDPEAPKVQLKLTVLPAVAAEVGWGRKKFGTVAGAPLQIQWPRNSGPLDLVINARGFLPLHTRLHTDRDDTLVVRLVRPAEARSLLGWRPPGNPASAPAR